MTDEQGLPVAGVEPVQLTQKVELLDALDTNGNILKTGPKQEILDEQRRVAFATGESPYAVPVVYLILHNPERGVYIVQREKKSVDPLLWSETVSGHKGYDEKPDATLKRETKEEGGIGIVIAQSVDEYFERVNRERAELWRYALARKVEIDPEFKVYRVDRDTHTTWSKWTQAHFYIGVFYGNLELSKKTGAEEFSDGLGEVRDWKLVPHHELKRALAENDPNYGQSLAVMMKRYGTLL